MVEFIGNNVLWVGLLVEALLMLVVSLLYLGLSRRQEKLELERQRLVEELEQRPTAVWERVQREAERLLEEARRRAVGIVSQAEWFKGEQEQKLSEGVARALSQFEKQLGGELNKIVVEAKEDLRKESVTATQVLERAREEMFKELGEIFAQEKVGYQKELEEYRQRQRQELAARVEAVVEGITGEVLAKGLGSGEQHKLVMEALEKAEKDGVF